MRKEGLRMTHYNIRSALHIASLFVHTLTHSSNGIWWDLNGLWQTEGSQSHCVVWMMMNFSVNSSRSRFYLSSCSWNALQYSPIWVCNSAVVCLLVLYSLWILSLLRWMDGWMKELTERFVVGISSKYIHIATRFLLNDTTIGRWGKITSIILCTRRILTINVHSYIIMVNERVIIAGPLLMSVCHLWIGWDMLILQFIFYLYFRFFVDSFRVVVLMDGRA